MRSPGNRNQRVAPSPCSQRKKQAAWQQGACVPQDPAEQTHKQNPQTEQNTKNDFKKNPKTKSRSV